MRKSTTYVGLDAHKKLIQVAMLIGRGKEFIEWTVANEAGAIRRMVKRIRREAKGHVRICYEAGPCGYALKRQLEKLGCAARSSPRAWCRARIAGTRASWRNTCKGDTSPRSVPRRPRRRRREI